MKLHRLILTTPTENISRGVWADEMIVEDGVYYFRNLPSVESGVGGIVAAFPTQLTSVTNIETKEEYEAKKERSDTYLSSKFEKLNNK
jgi:hypothetical protein